MPLFTWQLSEIATDFSSPCDFKLPSSPWTTRWGESLDLSGRPYHLENLTVVVRRSQSDEALDRASLALYNNTSWLFMWSLIEVVMSIGCIWWFLLQDKQNRASHTITAVFLTGLAVFICFLLSQVHIVSFAGPAVGWAPYYIGENCQGTITFSASLLKTHYQTPAILFAGLLMEFGALGMMFVILKKSLPQSVVG
jgi:hypothetical protein